MLFSRKSNRENTESHYVWVDGFKFTDANMCGMNDYQYAIGGSYSIPSDPVICETGFHFCLKLYDCLRWCGDVFEKDSRFFHVKALVKEEDLNSYNYMHKIAAKEIQIVSEVSDSELLEAVREVYTEVDSVDDLNRYDSYKLFLKDKLKSMLKQNGFSEAFILFYIYEYSELRNYLFQYRRIKAIICENISHDLKVYELLKIVEK